MVQPDLRAHFYHILILLIVFIVCTALFLSDVTVHCLLHGFLDAHLLIHSWCDIARNRVGTVVRR